MSISYRRGGSRGRVQGCAPPPPEMTCGFLIQLVFTSGHQSVKPFLSGAPPSKNILDPPLDLRECCSYLSIRFSTFLNVISTCSLTPLILTTFSHHYPSVGGFVLRCFCFVFLFYFYPLITLKRL